MCNEVQLIFFFLRKVRHACIYEENVLGNLLFVSQAQILYPCDWTLTVPFVDMRLLKSTHKFSVS